MRVSLGSPRRSEVASVAMWMEQGEKGGETRRGALVKVVPGSRWSVHTGWLEESLMKAVLAE